MDGFFMKTTNAMKWPGIANKFWAIVYWITANKWEFLVFFPIRHSTSCVCISHSREDNQLAGISSGARYLPWIYFQLYMVIIRISSEAAKRWTVTCQHICGSKPNNAGSAFGRVMACVLDPSPAWLPVWLDGLFACKSAEEEMFGFVFA